MRSRGLLLAAVLAIAGCTSDPPGVDGADASAVGPIDETTETIVGEQDGDSDDEVPEALAFAEQDEEAKAVGEPGEDNFASDSSDDDALEPTSGVDAEPRSEGDDNAEGEPDVEGSEPATTGDVGIDARIDELIDFVEAERGLSFRERPAIELLDNEAFGAAWTQIVTANATANSQEYTNFTDIYRALGVIEGDFTLEEVWLRFGDAGVIGFYDTSSKVIKLRSGDFNLFTETVLVHELVHALEDQVFGLALPQSDDGGESDWAYSALVEGSALRVESAFRATLSADELAEESAAREQIPRTVSFSEFTPSFLELQFGRYRYGETFVAELWEVGPEALEDAYDSPPETSEAILDPAGYLAGSLDPDDVPLPPADGDVFESGIWGQAAWAALFNDVVSRIDAEDAADGWDGDSYVAWRQAGQTCVRSHLVADTPQQLDDFAVMLEEWASFSSNREVFYPTADLIRVTACG